MSEMSILLDIERIIHVAFESDSPVLQPRKVHLSKEEAKQLWQELRNDSLLICPIGEFLKAGEVLIGPVCVSWPVDRELTKE